MLFNARLGIFQNLFIMKIYNLIYWGHWYLLSRKIKKVEYNIKKSNFSFSSEFIYLFKIKIVDLKLKLKI